LTEEFINFEKNYLGVPEELNFHKENESETISIPKTIRIEPPFFSKK
jgi:stress response protein YsnF